MTPPETALLLIGSAKRAGESTSDSLGSYLLQRLVERGVSGETRYVARELRSVAHAQALAEAVDQVDLFLLSSPLYVDSLPYLATKALERIAAYRQAQPAPRPVSFLAIVNCGFPEAGQNASALAICQQFAQAAGCVWQGGLAIGQGGMISGKRLAPGHGPTANVTAALDQVAAALAAGERAPEAAIAQLARPMFNAGLYTMFANLGWLGLARQNRALSRLWSRPFKPEKG
jgi:hypothetical protein